MIPAAIVAWQQWLGPAASRRAVRPTDPAADAATASLAKATLAASLGRDAHSLQYAATPEGARVLAEDMAAVNMDRAAQRPAGRCGQTVNSWGKGAATCVPACHEPHSQLQVSSGRR